MLTSALFLSTTLQAYVAATSLKARSQQMNTAIANIQADLAGIRHIAQVVPKNATECQLPDSGSSYVQQMMTTLKNNDTTTFGSPQTQSPLAIIGPIEQGQDSSILQQTSTLPIESLSDDYKMRRTLSFDKREGPSAQVLQISYQVLRQTSSLASGEFPSEEVQNEKFQHEGKAAQPPVIQTQSETLIAQLHTSILPNAALVCF